MGTHRLRLHAIGPDFDGKVWDSDRALCIGRSLDVEVSVPDTSLSRRHAEVVPTEQGWVVRDLGSKNGTFLNGIRVGQVERRLHPRDLLQCGNAVMVVVLSEDEVGAHRPPPADTWQVQNTTRHSWEEALHLLALDVTRRAQPSEQLLTLLRAGQHLYQVSSFDELLRLNVRDVVTAVKARRGTVLLADPATNRLLARASCAREPGPTEAAPYSGTLAERCYRRGESLLCQDVNDDPELLRARSVGQGGMSSVICALLRTPQENLGVLHLDRGMTEPAFTLDDLNLADGLAAGLSASVASARLLHEKQRNVFIQTVIALTQTLELRDPTTSGHTRRVTEYVLLMADELGLTPAERQSLLVVAPLHDIGKIGIDDAILRKTGDLTPPEYERMKEHSVLGAALLRTIPDLVDAAPVVRSHHERWDGKGYPDGLAGTDIPRLARVIAVADTFDALTTDAAYRRGLPAEAALEQLQEAAGTQFDPDCARAFRHVLPRLATFPRQRGS